MPCSGRVGPSGRDPKIPPGKTFDEVIDQALEKAKCVIVLWSKASVKSKWVKAEASEGNRRGILLPALIEDDAKIPLEFRYTQASRLTDWRGEAEHTEFGTLRAAVSELLAVPEEVFLDPETKLMWTMKDNGKDIDWPEASQYAEELTLAGYSDWRLPTIDELEKLFDPEGSRPYKIRKPFRLTGWWVWSSTEEGSRSAWFFDFHHGGRRANLILFNSGSMRALCVRRSEERQQQERMVIEEKSEHEVLQRKADAASWKPRARITSAVEGDEQVNKLILQSSQEFCVHEVALISSSGTKLHEYPVLGAKLFSTGFSVQITHASLNLIANSSQSYFQHSTFEGKLRYSVERKDGVSFEGDLPFHAETVSVRNAQRFKLTG